ncbi:hypothetical protein KCP78_10475 [Salmonella enterica subsp. enterica]|nr:hypothetical protein KCP78_10475 [Salmonella enterica subsp. enterica]
MIAGNLLAARRRQLAPTLLFTYFCVDSKHLNLSLTEFLLQATQQQVSDNAA